MNIMEMTKDDVIEINIYKNGVIYNKHHNRYYKLKKYAKIMLLADKKVLILDLISGANLTNRDYLEIVKEGRLVKKLFDSVYKR